MNKKIIWPITNSISINNFWVFLEFKKKIVMDSGKVENKITKSKKLKDTIIKTLEIKGKPISINELIENVIPNWDFKGKTPRNSIHGTISIYSHGKNRVFKRSNKNIALCWWNEKENEKKEENEKKNQELEQDNLQIEQPVLFQKEPEETMIKEYITYVDTFPQSIIDVILETSTKLEEELFMKRINIGNDDFSFVFAEEAN
jgi:hypothetical protein